MRTISNTIYQNYHKHTYDSNVFTPDSATSIEDYAKRCVELGHTVLTSMEHGFQGRYYDVYDVAKNFCINYMKYPECQKCNCYDNKCPYYKNGLKFIFGTEAYWVKNRREKDRTNGHICIFAKNEQGRRQINSILSEANISGYYYKPRLDLELIMSLNPDDVFVTSACVAFWHYDDIEDIVLKFKNHFQDSFMLEVQYHNTDKQRQLNQKILSLSNKYNIDIIMGCDSHYIYPEQAQDREYILESKGIKYEDEIGWYMDYPDGNTAYQRFIEQGVLSDDEIKHAMENTNIFLTFDDIDFDKDIKIPPFNKNLTQQERNLLYAKLIAEKWKEEKVNIPDELHSKYEEEIKKEVKTVIETNMSDYFLWDYIIVKDALNNGGVITSSGRGSSSSFFTNSLLGFSSIDRISSPIKLYPERFMSKTRILETVSLPDLDLNCGNPEIFAQSQKKLMGEGHAYPMIAFGTYQAKSAWKMYAKANKISFDIANKVSDQIDQYERELKYANEEDKDLINIYDFVDEEFHNLVKESEKYQGITTDRKAHPCGYLLYDGDIREEIGLIMCKSESTKKETITTVIDGSVAEKYKFLKNDLLKVDVIMLIHKIYQRIGMKQHNIRDLAEITKNNTKVWDIYAKGLTVGVNQVEKDSTRKKVMRYKPQNISELTAFIAAIRPSFKSIYPIFERREKFEYGIPSFDKLIQTPEMPNSFILYQEQIMTTLMYAGFHADETYGLIKAISKKKPESIYKIKDKFINGFSNRIMEEDKVAPKTAQKMSEDVWHIIEDSSQYGFNAAHAYSYAFDSLYCAYLKSHYPLEFYEVLMEEYSKKGNKDKVIELKKEMQEGFGIEIGDIRFGLDNRGFRLDREHWKINQSILSLKYMNYKISDELYQLSKNNKYNNFYELLLDIKTKTTIQSNQLEILVKLNYFRDFGRAKRILAYIPYFNTIYDAKVINQGKFNKDIEQIIQKYSRRTKKQFRDLNNKQILLEIWEYLPNEDFNVIEKIQYELEYLGYANIIDNSIPSDCAIVINIDTNRWGTKFFSLYRPNNGDIETVKVYKNTFDANPINEFDMIRTIGLKIQNKRYKQNNQWVISDEKEKILNTYARVIV